MWSSFWGQLHYKSPGFARFYNMTVAEVRKILPDTAKVFAFADNLNGPRCREFEVNRDILEQIRDDGTVNVVFRWDPDTNSLTNEIVAAIVAFSNDPGGEPGSPCDNKP
jgi:uncharacterized protein YwbE